MESKVNHQGEPVCSVGPNKMRYIAVHHELGNHRALPGATVDLHRDKAKDVGVGYILPEDGFLAEILP